MFLLSVDEYKCNTHITVVGIVYYFSYICDSTPIIMSKIPLQRNKA